MKPPKIKVSITLDSDLVEMLKVMAKEDDRAFSQYVNFVLRKWVAAHTEKTDDASTAR